MTLTVTLASTPITVSLANCKIAVNLTPTQVAVSLAGVGPQGATGPAGPTGATGPTGPGVPTGGSAGQALVKIDDANFNTEWSTITSGVSSFNTRTGAVSSQSGDYSIGEISGAAMVASTGAYGDLTGKPTLGALASLNSVSLTSNVTGILPPTQGGSGIDNGSNTLTLAGNATLSGTNSGDQTITLSGDITGSGTAGIFATLNTVNGNIGTFNSLTVNAKGLVTSATNVAYQSPITLTTSGSSGAATFSGGSLNIPQYAGTTYAAGTGLTLAGSTFSVNASQSISSLSNLTSNGLVKTSGGTGLLSMATAGTDYVIPAGSITGNAGTVSTINGLVAQGTNVTISGAGTTASPYSIAASGGSPGGSSGQVQFNGGTTFAGSANFLWNNTTNTLEMAAGVAVSGSTTPVTGVPGWFSGFSCTQAGPTNMVVESTSNACAFVARGQSEADMILQNTGAASGQQCFYFRVKNGNFDILVLNDSLNFINNYCYSTRYDGRSSWGFGSSNPTTFPGILSVGSNANAAPNLVAQASSGQSVDMQQWQNSIGAILSNVDHNGAIASGRSTTSGRPTVSTIGAQWFDTTLGIPIWWNGSNWINASGSTV